MDSGLVMELLIGALRMTAILGGPVIVTVLIVGIVIGALQSATQINEPAVAFVPKLLAVMLVMAVTGASTLGIFVDYVREMIIRIPQIAG
jgi:flagellar biosynthetic protein FliQ